MDEKKKILVIEPDIQTRQLYHSIMLKKNIEVDGIGSIGEALDKIKNHDYGCIILDVSMRRTKDCDSVKIIRSIEPDVPLIITTARNNRDQEAKIREQNIFYYYLKNFEIDELLQAVQNAVSNPE